MSTLLHLDSSPMDGASVSRQLSADFVQRWQTLNPSGQVIRRDLVRTDIAPVTPEWVGAAYTPATSRSQAQRSLLSQSDELINELRQADEYVFGVPMHNFSVPARLKLWIDAVVRPGETFAYEDGTPQGLLNGKKAAFVVASGGVYDEGSAFAPYNFVDPYLRAIFGFIGVHEVSVVRAGGTSALNSETADRAAFLQPSQESIQKLFNPA